MRSKNKVLFIVEAMGGGVFTYLVDLANELVDTYEMFIAYAVRPQTPENYRDYFDDRVHLIEVQNFTRSLHPGKDIKAFFEIRKIAKEVQPDIIHLHSSKAGALGRFAFNGIRIPLFYTPHGYSFLMEDCGNFKRILYKAIEMLCAKRKCTTISCSEGEYLETLKLTHNAFYVNNGININEMDGLLSHIGKSSQQRFTVFTLGRICYQKNPSLFNKVANALPDVNFLWIGDGELRSELTAENIKITGWMDRGEAIAQAASADVFILTSLWEGMPISLLESMYMKKPCLVSDVIGNHDVIHDGENGFICKDVSEYISAIKRAMEGDCEKLVDNAYRDIMQKYNTKVMAERYNTIYQEALGRGT